MLESGAPSSVHGRLITLRGHESTDRRIDPTLVDGMISGHHFPLYTPCAGSSRRRVNTMRMTFNLLYGFQKAPWCCASLYSMTPQDTPSKYFVGTN